MKKAFLFICFILFIAKIPLAAREKELSPFLIKIDSRLGYVFLYEKNKLLKTQLVTDPDYRKAVLNNELHKFWNIPILKPDKEGNFNTDVRIIGFPHINQIAGTCYEASYREWCVYFAGQDAADAPCLWDVGLFNTAVKKRTFKVSYHKTLAKNKISKDGTVSYNNRIDHYNNRAKSYEIYRWLGKYMNIKMASSIPYKDSIDLTKLEKKTQTSPSASYKSKKLKRKVKDYTAVVRKQLLLGHGVVASCEIKGGGLHALNIYGTQDDNLHISTWARSYFGPSPEFGLFQFRDRISVLIPQRDATGRTITGLADHIASESLPKEEASTNIPQTTPKKNLKKRNDFLPRLSFVDMANIIKNPKKFHNRSMRFMTRIHYNSNNMIYPIAHGIPLKMNGKEMTKLKQLIQSLASSHKLSQTKLLKNRYFLFEGLFKFEKNLRSSSFYHIELLDNKL